MHRFLLQNRLFSKNIIKKKGKLTITEEKKQQPPIFSLALALVLLSSVWVDQGCGCHLGCRGWSSGGPLRSLQDRAGYGQLQQGSLEICREQFMAEKAIPIFIFHLRLLWSSVT